MEWLQTDISKGVLTKPISHDLWERGILSHTQVVREGVDQVLSVAELQEGDWYREVDAYRINAEIYKVISVNEKEGTMDVQDVDGGTRVRCLDDCGVIPYSGRTPSGWNAVHYLERVNKEDVPTE
jgi:hypothetical protein